MIDNSTVETKCVKTMKIGNTDSDKTRFIVLLLCMADSRKLQTHGHFQVENVAKIIFPPGIFVCFYEIDR